MHPSLSCQTRDICIIKEYWNEDEDNCSVCEPSGRGRKEVGGMERLECRKESKSFSSRTMLMK